MSARASPESAPLPLPKSLAPAVTRWALPLALGALGVLLVLALAVGAYPLRPTEVWLSLAAALSGQDEPLPATAQAVLWQVRGPRALAAVAVGAALGAAGAAFQTLFRNPLVAPDILGVSAGCGLGAALAIVLGLPLAWVSGLALLGGLGAVALVVAVAQRAHAHDPVLMLVLCGVAVAALLGAGLSVIKLLADPSVQLPSIVFWLMGGLTAVTTADLGLALPWLGVGLALLLALRWRINLLALPDDEALSLGAPVRALRLTVVLGATLATAAAVAMAGIVGWVGLVVPHLARLWVGPSFAALMPLSAALGAAFVLLADTLARSLTALELPLSVLTAAVGAPFLLGLLLRRGRAEG